jgi:hypothetical protein
MKPKARKPSAPRNPFVAAAKFKKAGAHTKPHKALRRQEKVNEGRLAHLVEHPAFNRMVPSSNLGTPTTQSEFQNSRFRNSLLQLQVHRVPVAQSDRAQPSEG